jgi:hypothetical protein
MIYVYLAYFLSVGIGLGLFGRWMLKHKRELPPEAPDVQTARSLLTIGARVTLIIAGLSLIVAAFLAMKLIGLI